MSEHPIKELMDTTMDKIRQMVDVDTIIGDPITPSEGIVIIPVSKIAYGFVSGGSDLPTRSEKILFGGGTGAGITITPIAFIVIQDGDAKLLHVAVGDNAVSNIVKLVPEALSTIGALFKKKDKTKTEECTDIPKAETV